MFYFPTFTDMLAFGDIWDRASNCHHCACCLVEDSQFHYRSNALYTRAAAGISLADDFTGCFHLFSVHDVGIHTSIL